MKNTNNVPRLRFPNFTDDWEQRKLGNVADLVGGGTPSTQNPEYWDGDIDWYAPAEIANQIYVKTSQRKITEQGYDNSSAKLLPPGTVLFTSRAGIGKTAILARKGCTNQGFQSIVPHKNELDTYFIFSRTEELKRYGELVGAGSTFVEVSGKQMAAMDLMLPSTIQEQQMIGVFFEQLDNLITLHQRKCDKLEEYKKAMLQKIFSQELRFKREDGTEYPEWEEKKFGTTVLIERGGSPRPIKQYITNGDGYNWVKIGDAPEHGNYITHTEEKIKKSGLNKTRQVFKGDLILSNSMSFGKPYIMAIDGCIHDGWLLIRNNQNIYNLKFLCYLLGTDYMLKQYKSLAGGSTVNNLNKELVSMTTVSVPCLEEQQKIADFLSALDETISYAKQEFDKWKELKKGLLQQMFV